MIKFENITVAGFEAAIRGMRNPKNSWSKSDSHPGLCGDEWSYDPGYIIGQNDKDLMLRLNKGGPVHAKYRRQIVVWVDLVMPTYVWAEFDTYKVGTVRNSCSFMHKGTSKTFEIVDFSFDVDEIRSIFMSCCSDGTEAIDYINGYVSTFEKVIQELNALRDIYLKTKDDRIFQLIRRLLPSGYNLRATITLNYEVLSKMYHDRKHHRLDEWRAFCKWVETLPYSWIITGDAPGMEVAPRDPHPYDLSDEKKREISQQPDVEPEFYCRITPDEIPDFERWMKTKRSMDLYVDNQFVGELWSIEPLMAYTLKPTQLESYDLGFRIIDHDKGKDLQMDYSMGRYSHAFAMDPVDCHIRMQLYRKE